MARDGRARSLAAAARSSVANIGTTGFSQFKRKLEAGQSAHVQIWSDSTGNSRDNPGRWPDKVATYLVAKYPTHSVIVHTWNTTSGLAYDAAVTLSTGSTSAECHIWNFAVSGTIMQYGMGSKWLPALALNPIDGLIINHGINYFPGWDIAGTTGAEARGAMIAGIEQFMLAHPGIPISVIIQLPNRDTTALDNMNLYWRTICARYDLAPVDIYSLYIAAGKASSLYLGDGIHPSEPTGNQLCADAVWAHFQNTSVRSLTPAFSHLSRVKPNLLVNGDFRTWSNTTIAPDSWTTTGTVAFTKDLTAPADPALGYSVKMLGSGAAQAYISQAVSSTWRVLVAGKRLTLRVRNKMAVAGALTVGRIGLIIGGTGGVTYNSVNGSTAVVVRDDWNEIVFSDVPIPADCNGITVRLYADSATTPDTTNAAWWDQVWLGLGDTPYAAR